MLVVTMFDDETVFRALKGGAGDSILTGAGAEEQDAGAALRMPPELLCVTARPALVLPCARDSSPGHDPRPGAY